jgi:hypothetical protein
MIRELLDVQKLYRNTSDFPSKEEENVSKHFEKYFGVRKVRKKVFSVRICDVSDHCQKSEVRKRDTPETSLDGTFLKF